MLFLPLNVNPKKMEEIDAHCELLGMTRSEYADLMFAIGNWAVEKSKEGRLIVSVDVKADIYTQIDFPQFKTLREAYAAIKSFTAK